MSSLESIGNIYEEQLGNPEPSDAVAVDAITTYLEARDRLAFDLENNALTTEQEHAALTRLQSDVLHGQN